MVSRFNPADVSAQTTAGRSHDASHPGSVYLSPMPDGHLCSGSCANPCCGATRTLLS
jgi:hypothetical protein